MTTSIHIVHQPANPYALYRVELFRGGNVADYVECSGSNVAGHVDRWRNTYPSADVLECNEDGTAVDSPVYADDHATGSDGADGDAGAAVEAPAFPIGATVIVQYEGSPGFIAREQRQGVVIGYRGSRNQYVLVDVERCNLPKTYAVDAVVAVERAAVA